MSTGLVIPSYAMGFARNAAEAAYPELWRGLVGCWCPFLGPGGMVLRDISGHHNHGTLTNMDPATGWVPARYGWGLEFDGSNDWMSCGSGVIGAATTFSCFIVARIRASTANRHVCDSSDGATGFGLRTGLGQTFDFFVYRSGGLSSIDDQGSFTVDDWIAIAGVMHPDRIELFLDGQLVASDAANTGAMVSGGNLAIGAEFDGGARWLNTQIAVGVIWSRALAAAEIHTLSADAHAVARLRRRIPRWAPQRAGVRVLAAYDRDEEVGEATSLQLYGNDGEGGAMDWDNAIGSASLATALKHQVVEIESSELWHGRTYNVEVRARTDAGTESDNTDTTEVTADGVGPGTPTLQTDIV